jgi:hypothetical protein
MNSHKTEALANCTLESLSRFRRERGRERACENSAFTWALSSTSPTLFPQVWERE